MNVPFNGQVLKLGSHGDPVFAVKRALKKAGSLTLIAVGKLYDPLTVASVRRFQKSKGLHVDGRVGPVTLKALSPFFDEYGYWLYTSSTQAPSLQLPMSFRPTHETGGLPDFPSVDCFAPPGTTVLAPEAGGIVYPHLIRWDRRKAVGGWTCYLQAKDATYFLTHFTGAIEAGPVAKSEILGTVAAVPHNWWPSHIHLGKHRGRYNPEA